MDTHQPEIAFYHRLLCETFIDLGLYVIRSPFNLHRKGWWLWWWKVSRPKITVHSVTDGEIAYFISAAPVDLEVIEANYIELAVRLQRNVKIEDYLITIDRLHLREGGGFAI